MALLGLQQDENLYLGAKGWEADYVPGVVARGPFFIGYQRREVNGKIENDPVVHVDLEQPPRSARPRARPCSRPKAANTRYLDNIAGLLNGISQGLEVSKPMFEAFKAADLIEPVQLEVKVNSEEQFNLTGMYTISREKLAGLDADTLFRLHRAGYLQGAFLVLSSMANVQRLIDLKNRRRHQAAVAS